MEEKIYIENERKSIYTNIFENQKRRKGNYDFSNEEMKKNKNVRDTQ